MRLALAASLVLGCAVPVGVADAALPDLVVWIVGTSEPGQRVIENEPYRLQVTVRNVGEASVIAPFIVYFWVDDVVVSDAIVEASPDAPLAPGAYANANARVQTQSYAGWHDVTVLVDTAHAIPESDESNNEGAGRVSISRLFFTYPNWNNAHLLATSTSLVLQQDHDDVWASLSCGTASQVVVSGAGGSYQENCSPAAWASSGSGTLYAGEYLVSLVTNGGGGVKLFGTPHGLGVTAWSPPERQTS